VFIKLSVDIKFRDPFYNEAKRRGIIAQFKA